MTKGDVIAQARRRYPSMTAAQAGILFDEAYRRLLLTAPIRNASSVLTIVPGQRTYDLPSGTVRIHGVDYAETGSDPMPLEETSRSGLDTIRPGWRNLQSGRPFAYYVEFVPSGDGSKAVLSFETAPGGIAAEATVYYTSLAALDDADALPEQIPSFEVFTDWMYRMWCKENDAENVGFWDEAARRSLAETVDAVKNMQANSTEPAFYSMHWPRLSRPV
jgi:hypothetical protein